MIILMYLTSASKYIIAKHTALVKQNKTSFHHSNLLLFALSVVNVLNKALTSAFLLRLAVCLQLGSSNILKMTNLELIRSLQY